MVDVPLEQPPSNLPHPLPEVPKKRLWACLLTPTLATVAAFLLQLAVMLVFGTRSDEVVVGFAYLTWFAGSVVALLCLPWFVLTLKKRFRGKSLVLLSLAYLFGQIIIQLPLGFGGCLAALNLTAG